MEFVGTDLTKNSRSVFKPTGGTFTYTDGNLTRVDYDEGKYKILTYTSGNLTRVDFFNGSVTIRKDFVYSGGALASITETVI